MHLFACVHALNALAEGCISIVGAIWVLQVTHAHGHAGKLSTLGLSISRQQRLLDEALDLTPLPIGASMMSARWPQYVYIYASHDARMHACTHARTHAHVYAYAYACTHAL